MKVFFQEIYYFSNVGANWFGLVPVGSDDFRVVASLQTSVNLFILLIDVYHTNILYNESDV